VTEGEAKTKWCPHARVHYGSIDGVNRGTPAIDSGSRCIGSACMAWQWIDQMTATDDEYEFKSVRTGGFCGLTGHL